MTQPHPEIDELLALIDNALEETMSDTPTEEPQDDAPDADAPDDWADPVEPEDDTIPEPGAYGDG